MARRDNSNPFLANYQPFISSVDSPAGMAETGQQQRPVISNKAAGDGSLYDWLYNDDTFRRRILQPPAVDAPVNRPPTPMPRRSRPLHSTAVPAPTEYSEDMSMTMQDRAEERINRQDGISTSELNKAILKKLDQMAREPNASQASTGSSNNRVDLKLPRFDGQGDVALFIRQFTEVCQISNWSDRVALVQLRSCLEKGAKDCGWADSAPEINRRLLNKYSLSPAEARHRLHLIQRQSDESYLSLGNRVEKLVKLAYGNMGEEYENQMALEYFDRAIEEPALRRHLLVVKAGSIDQAVAAAEQYDLVDRPLTRPHRARDNHRVAQVDDTNCLQVSSEPKVETILQSISRKLDKQEDMMKEQAKRIAVLEKNRSSTRLVNASTEIKRCYKCGDTTHFRRDCPLWQTTPSKRRNDQAFTNPNAENQ